MKPAETRLLKMAAEQGSVFTLASTCSPEPEDRAIGNSFAFRRARTDEARISLAGKGRHDL